MIYRFHGESNFDHKYLVRDSNVVNNDIKNIGTIFGKLRLNIEMKDENKDTTDSPRSYEKTAKYIDKSSKSERAKSVISRESITDYNYSKTNYLEDVNLNINQENNFYSLENLSRDISPKTSLKIKSDVPDSSNFHLSITGEGRTEQLETLPERKSLNEIVIMCEFRDKCTVIPIKSYPNQNPRNPVSGGVVCRFESRQSRNFSHYVNHNQIGIINKKVAADTKFIEPDEEDKDESEAGMIVVNNIGKKPASDLSNLNENSHESNLQSNYKMQKSRTSYRSDLAKKIIDIKDMKLISLEKEMCSVTHFTNAST
ncbi:hypothetical protein RF11_01050 [Thelohanellus kitauei]|uniref:Uncharacterized protein n=1 Tax=Thelohanellus kitauei TaxID=669202 RepID=A0A0C2MM54_THEKT|nr:hypothetical protein RF11_01050 [Thelohanellus kitauei]